jgi:hypothetical protein
VLQGWPGRPQDGLDVSELLGQPLAGRAARQRAELAREMGLIEVPAGHGQVSQPDAVRGGVGDQQVPGPVEANDPGGGLGRQADLGAEPAGEVAAAPAGLGRQFRHARGAARPEQAAPRPGDLGRYRLRPARGAAQQREQDLIEDREPFPPAARLGQAGAQFRAHAAEHAVRGQVDVRELPGRQAEQRPRAERPPRHLDAGLRARVRDQRRPGVQAAQQGAELTGRLPGVRVSQHGEGLVEREDQRQERRGQAPVPSRRHPALTVTGVPRDVAAQWLGGQPAAVLVNRARQPGLNQSRPSCVYSAETRFGLKVRGSNYLRR